MLLFLLGIAFMILGLTLMRLSLSHIFCHRLQHHIALLTTSPYRGFLLGMAGAMLLQGSTAVTLLSIALVSSRILPFPHSIAILLGANVGTCSTVPLLLAMPTIDWSDYASYCCILLALGLIIKRIRPFIGSMGGLVLMLEGFTLLRTSGASLVEVGDLLILLSSPNAPPFIGLIVGTILTFALQSASSATLLLTTLAEHHIISLHTICHIIYGNNIGSCLSSVLASVAASHEARKTAIANLILNIGGVLLFLPMTTPFLAITTALTDTTADRLVILHTTFNIVSSLLLLPITRQYAAFIHRVYPFKCT